jgi:hypothetical protein
MNKDIPNNGSPQRNYSTDLPPGADLEPISLFRTNAEVVVDALEPYLDDVGRLEEELALAVHAASEKLRSLEQTTAQEPFDAAMQMIRLPRRSGRIDWHRFNGSKQFGDEFFRATPILWEIRRNTQDIIAPPLT